MDIFGIDENQEGLIRPEGGVEPLLGEAVFGSERPAPLRSGLVVPEELTALTIENLARIYAVSFSGPPWFERWNRDSALRQLETYIGMEAKIAARFDENAAALGFELPIGLGVAMPLGSYEKNSEIVSFGASPDALYIADLCTDPAQRGRGVCPQIVSCFIDLAREQGITQLVSRTRTDNDAMIRVFEKLGFTRIGEYLTSTGGVTSERVVFKLDI